MITVFAFLEAERNVKLNALKADVSKYRPEVYKSEKSKILKTIQKVALGKLLNEMWFFLRSDNYYRRTEGGGGGGGGWGGDAVIGFAALGPGFTGPRRRVTKKSFFLMRTTNYLFRKVHNYMHFKG